MTDSLRRRRPSAPSRTPMRIDRPEPGYYKRRLYSRGPWIPALIWLDPARDPDTGAALDRQPALRCIVSGEEVDPHDVWTWLRPISEAEYRRLVRDREGVEDVADINTSAVRI